MSSLVQTKLTPPILVPLGLTASDLPRARPRIERRIKLIHDYALRFRQLADCEACELLDLKYLLENGTDRPRKRLAVIMTQDEIEAELLA